MNLFRWIRKEHALRASNRLSRRGNAAAALDLIDQALTENPGSPDLWIQKSWALSDLKRYDEALAAVAQGLGNDPENGILELIRGEALYATGRYEESKAALHRALDLSGDNLRIEHSLGITYVALGEMEPAARYLESSVRYDKSLVQARLLAMAERYLFEHRPR
ncbi:MAG: tetratricopeptide repeat protein [Pseudomonadota bacterium]